MMFKLNVCLLNKSFFARKNYINKKAIQNKNDGIVSVNSLFILTFRMLLVIELAKKNVS